MPRRTEPRREIGITLDEESIKDAMALWVKTYHGVNIDARNFELITEGGLSAKAIAVPSKQEKKGASSTDNSGT
jgi:hypothetical protein